MGALAKGGGQELLTIQRHQLTTEAFQTIQWQSMKYALAKLRPKKRALSVKVLHRHLPTHDKLFQQGRVFMCLLCPCCLQEAETNAHVICCTNGESLKQRQAALDEQTEIGWDKLLIGFGSNAWRNLQDYIDINNPKPPQQSAMAWMNTAIHQMLIFSLRCWKQRNLMVHSATRQDQKRIALQNAREKIKSIYANPPTLAPQFQSIYEVPLEHRLKMSLQSAEHWFSMISHQIKVTAHNFQLLIRQHNSTKTHLRAMRREQGTKPRNTHSRQLHGKHVKEQFKQRTRL